MPTSDIERAYTVNPFSPVGHGDIRGFADGSRFLLDSATRIASIVLETPYDEEAASVLLRRLEYGVPAALLPLTGMGVELTRGELLTLWRAGVDEIENIAAQPLAELERLIGVKGRLLHRLLTGNRASAG